MSNKSDAGAFPWSNLMPPFLTGGMVNPFGAMPGFGGGGAATPDVNAWMKALDPAELERRVSELKVVEMWLQSQVGLVQMTIQTLTMQKQSMEALRAATKPLNFGASPLTMPGTPAAPAKPKRRRKM